MPSMNRHTFRLSMFSPVKIAWIDGDRLRVQRKDGRDVAVIPIHRITKFGVLDNMEMQDKSGERFTTKIMSVRVGWFRSIRYGSFQWQGPGFGHNHPNRGIDESESYRELSTQLMEAVAVDRPDVRVVNGSVGVSIMWWIVFASSILVAIGAIMGPLIKPMKINDLAALWGFTLPFCAMLAWAGQSMALAYWPISSTVGERTGGEKDLLRE
ncbi:membrane protein [Rhodopirellula sp. SWK7]|nr:membrane protein [Rhodopirellula sp. SWK7]